MTDLAYQPLSAAAQLARAGEVTPLDLVDACLARVKTVDSDLHAWASLEQNQPRERAHALTGTARSLPLGGAPVGVKDNIDTAGTPTTAGSQLLADQVPAASAFVVRRLEEAGGIVLGKTACTELATNDPAPTRNPWNPALTPGGSSAGSGVAVATGMCFATVDTQTAGDILRPASYAGVVGFKPTYGRISRRGTVPVAWSIDTVGVQARTTRDVALLFSLLAAPDPDDPGSATLDVPDLTIPDLTGCTAIRRPPRIGVIRNYFATTADQQVREHTESVLAALADAGGEICEIDPPLDFSLLHAAHRTVTFSECATVHHDLYQRHADRMGEKLRTLLELGLATPAVSYLQAQRVRTRLLRTLRQALHAVDVVLSPPVPALPPCRHSGTGSAVLQIPWTFAGLPAISIPTGLSSTGLPMGVQLVADLNTEATLLPTAAWCEDVLDAHIPTPPHPVPAGSHT